MGQPQTLCRYFSGYKPCRHGTCSDQCPQKDLIQNSVLIVHLGALGAVVRSTALLAAIRRKYASAHITWVTDRPADQLLKNHPQIDRLLTTSVEDMQILAALSFDVAFVIDKSLKAAGVLQQTRAREMFGFKAEAKSGAIVPANSEALELWSLGLDNQKKFFENKKPETQLMIEALALGPFRREPYDLPLLPQELSLKVERERRWRVESSQPVIGINTGCSSTIPYKKLTVDYHRRLIRELHERGFKNIVLLGGPEDTERNAQIALGMGVISSPTEKGLRDGLVSVAACDIVVTGDSLGMHMAISQQLYTVAWFGPTCAHEIDLYDRGQMILTQAPCAPCWKRSCEQSIMCYDLVSLTHLVDAVVEGVRHWKKRENPSSLYKQPSWETSS